MELIKVLKGNFKVKSCSYDILHIGFGKVELSRKYIEIFPRNTNFKFLEWKKYSVILSNGENSIKIVKYNKDTFYEILQFCVNHEINKVEIYKR